MDSFKRHGMEVGVNAVLGKVARVAMPSELVSKLTMMRAEQNIKDRTAALNIMSVELWIMFCLRWGVPPPPQGFDDHEQLLGVMHMLRMHLPQHDDLQKLTSAHWLVSRGIKLPGTYRLRDGALTGGLNAD